MVEGRFNPGLFNPKFQPQTTPDFPTPSMGLKNPGFESSWLKSLGLKSPGLKSSRFKNLGLKGLGLKLGVEKSGVEMSFNHHVLRA